MIAQSNAAGAAIGIGFILFFMIMSLLYLGLIVLTCAGMWKAFVKAGKPGWAGIVPYYNHFVMVEISGKPLWWFFMIFVPCANLVFLIMTHLAVAERFGKGAGFGLGLTFLPFIFWPILGFGDAQFTPTFPGQGFAPIMPGQPYQQ